MDAQETAVVTPRPVACSLTIQMSTTWRASPSPCQTKARRDAPDSVSMYIYIYMMYICVYDSMYI